MPRRLELILKLTERCNIACTYCYYFENEHKSALHRPAKITDEAAAKFVERVHEFLDSEKSSTVRIIFHGGEPMMYGKAHFKALCTALHAQFHNRIQLCLQTNAVLIDDEWIAIFERYDIGVGVSIDGPSHIHDRNRVDKRGRPTYEAVALGIGLLVRAAQNSRISAPGALIVAQPRTSSREILNHLTMELGLSQFDFLLPDVTWDSAAETSWVESYFTELFHAWLESDQERINIRILRSTLSLLTGGPSYLGGYGPVQSNALTILSDGSINGDDFLRPCGDEFLELGVSLFDSSLSHAGLLNRFRLKAVGADALPSECEGCAFENTCCGGQLTHRFSREKLFANKTIYCADLKEFYKEVCFQLIRSGVSVHRLSDILCNEVTLEKHAHHQVDKKGTVWSDGKIQVRL